MEWTDAGVAEGEGIHTLTYPARCLRRKKKVVQMANGIKIHKRLAVSEELKEDIREELVGLFAFFNVFRRF